MLKPYIKGADRLYIYAYTLKTQVDTYYTNI